MPTSELVLGPDGNFYGMTEEGGAYFLGTVFRMTPGGTLTTLLHFRDDRSPTQIPTNSSAGLIVGGDGSFYGTSTAGGMRSNGTVFRLSPSRELRVLADFSGNRPPTPGTFPEAELVLGSDGDFYGTTASAGATLYGTVFRMTPAGTLTPLVHLNFSNGHSPAAELILGADGNFYGTTQYRVPPISRTGMAQSPKKGQRPCHEESTPTSSDRNA